MHFSVPETSDCSDGKGNKYTAYVLHIDGVRHCVVRYRQLHSLQEQLRKEFPSLQLLPAPFPPKKLLPLSLNQVEERRTDIEKYLQLVSQDPRVANSVTFNGFLLASQQETRNCDLRRAASEEAADSEVSLDVFLMNDQKVSVRGRSILQTEEVLERACAQLGVAPENVFHFALFLVRRREDNGELVVCKKLQDFESPYISHASLSAASGQKLVIRKACWDPAVDLTLLNDKASLNLLYVQTIAEVERGWITACPETRRRLAELQATGDKKGYMELAVELPLYGYVHFQPVVCDYPTSNTPAQIIIGNRELIMKIRTASGEIKEGSFKVTKMRCWRIMTQSQSSDELSAPPSSSAPAKLELSFEYLLHDQELRWISLVSSQAILMSLCLQAMVEELLRMRSDVEIKKAGEKSCCSEYSFLRRDGSVQKLSVRAGLHSKSAGCPQVPKIDPKTLASMTSRAYSVKKLSERFDRLNFRDAARAAEDVLFENEAFMDLRDRDEAEQPDKGL